MSLWLAIKLSVIPFILVYLYCSWVIKREDNDKPLHLFARFGSSVLIIVWAAAFVIRGLAM